MADKSIHTRQRNPFHGLPVLYWSKRPSLIRLAFLLLFLVFSGCGKGGAKPANVKFIKQGGSGPVVVLGDSLSKGVGIKPEETWVALVAGKQGIEIENLAKTGFNTEVSVPRVDKEVLPLKPRLVVVELGGNDALQRVEKSKTEANLEAILGKLQEEKIPVLLLGVQGGVLSDPYEDMFASLAHTYQTGYVSNILEGIVGHQELLVDNFHPNGKGHALIAERVGPVLEAMLEAQGRGQNKSKDTKS